jgi:hypothetical protein
MGGTSISWRRARPPAASTSCMHLRGVCSAVERGGGVGGVLGTLLGPEGSGPVRMPRMLLVVSGCVCRFCFFGLWASVAGSAVVGLVVGVPVVC